MKVVLIKRKYVIYGSLIFLLLLLTWLIGGYFYSENTVPTIQNVDPIYQGKTDQPNVAITINVDWGEDIVPQMLKILKEKEVQATFFITGRFASKFPEVVREIVAHGQEIGNHGYSHPHPDQISLEKNKEEIEKTHKILQEFTEEKIFLFAPPYGERGENCLKAANQLGYKIILWTADTVDWQKPAPSVIVERVTGKKLTNGTIILMHPTPNTLEALPVIIDTIREKGYVLKKVSEII